MLTLRRFTSLSVPIWALATFVQIVVGDDGVAAQQTRLKHAFNTVSSAVVRVALEKNGHSGIGVILSREGHVLAHGAPHFSDQPLYFLLPDGRIAQGGLLSWSEEWNVSLAKITDPGPWPFVEMLSKEKTIRLREDCFTVGYQIASQEISKTPSQQLGKVSRQAGGVWLESSCLISGLDGTYYGFGPLFNRDGQMLGNTAALLNNSDVYHIHANQIRTIWNDLASGNNKNLDKERLLKIEIDDESSRPYAIRKQSQQDLAAAKETAIASTVRFRSADGSARGSGVIISANGFIATCGHGSEMPGNDLIVQLSDGRDVPAKVVGVNPITDIGLVQLVENGPWPYSPLCDTSHVAAELPCWVIGYPSDPRYEGDVDARKPLVRSTRIIYPINSEWSYRLHTHHDYKMYGGDSGGGVFDWHGRLLAINVGKDFGAETPGEHSRVETIRQQWEILVNMNSMDK